jgi:hypothetical protein
LVRWLVDGSFLLLFVDKPVEANPLKGPALMRDVIAERTTFYFVPVGRGPVDRHFKNRALTHLLFTMHDDDDRR